MVTMNLFGARITPSLVLGVTIAMIAIGVMAAAVPEALGDRAAAFAVGNAVIRLVWALPWFTKRRLVGVPWWRPVLYSVVPAVLWLASIWIAPPWQYLLWAFAVAIEAGSPTPAAASASGRVIRSSPSRRLSRRRPCR